MARATREQWAKRVESWKRSGLTAAQFASRHGLSPRSLSWWKWRLSTSARAAPPVVEVVALTRQSGDPFELVLGERVRVRVPAGFDAEDLRRLLEAVEGR